MAIFSEELLPEVLSFLPSIDLLRFRCVSKSWRALIDSQYFIQLHLNKSLEDIKSSKVLLVARHVGGDCPGLKFSTVGYDSEFKFSVPREIMPPIEDASGDLYIGSCRSLTCLEYEEKICLWNPSTRSHRILPTPPKCHWCESVKTRYKLGYDELADDYKVVRLTFDADTCSYGAKLYSLKLDTWKDIEKVQLPFECTYISSPIIANGGIIWLLEKEKRPSLLVLSLTTEVLHLVPLPEDLDKFSFEFRCCFYLNSCEFYENGHFRCLRGFGDCDCQFRYLLDLINKNKNGTLANFLLEDFDIDGGIDCLNVSFHEKLCSELRSLSGDARSSEVPFIYLRGVCFWVDSLFRVEKSTISQKIENEESESISSVETEEA